jgi:hypothetical protein
MKSLFDWEPWRTLLLLVISAFVLFVFYKAFFDNPALAPERMGQTAEESSEFP